MLVSFRQLSLRAMTAVLALCAVISPVGAATLSSPNGKVHVNVAVAERITYSVTFSGKPVVDRATLSLTLEGDRVLGKDPQLEATQEQSIDQELRPVVPVKSALIRDRCNILTLAFEGDYRVQFRAYDDAVAYRFETALPGKVKVLAEEVSIPFAKDAKVFFPEEESFQTHSERLYLERSLSEITAEQFCSLPVMVDLPQGPKVVITEADLYDYAGLYLQGSSGRAFQGRFPAVALAERKANDRDVPVTRRAAHIAEVEGTRVFPWRVLVLAAQDKELLENQTVYKLSRPSALDDTSWIKPGKIAWDWWNANNVYGVDFRAGVNTETYKYYIDFAAAHNLEYIVLDEGWYELGNLLKVSPGMDLEALFAYAKVKGVGIILWVVWKTLEDQLQPALDQFQKWGAVGVKVDFMQRDDQWMVNYYWRIAEECAKRKMMVDFHGAYSPKGLHRSYPNVVTREGVKGLENCKWSADITPDHDCTLPFIRMLAGPMDYTPGAMSNMQQSNFNAVFTQPMSQGTRCHQLAMYVIYESPLQMLADSPSQYEREPECMEFLSAVPSVWDETVALDGKVGDYCVTARRSGQDWYVGAMTDWTARDVTIGLAFLGAGEYQARIYQDGINADLWGSDYKKVTRTVSASDKLEIKLAPGGGWVVRLSK